LSFALKLLGMILGVIILTQLARVLGLGGQERIESADHARRLARQDRPDFDGVAVAIDSNGQAALVSDRNWKLMLIRVKGPRFVTRLLDKGATTRLDSGALTISLDEPDFPPTTLTLGDDATRWATALGNIAHG
jgi:hypothetical protein